MQNIKTFLKNLWRDESAQGTAEYVLLLVVVVAVVILFRGRIKDAVTGRLDEVDKGFSSFTTDP